MAPLISTKKLLRLFTLVLVAKPVHVYGYVSFSALYMKASSTIQSNRRWQSTTKVAENIRVGDLLSDLPTPSLLLELSMAENAAGEVGLDAAVMRSSDPGISFEGSLFVHTKVTDTSERDTITRIQGSGKSSLICTVDTPPDMIPGGAFLGIGLANHHVGGYYWARGMGIGASLPAHGIDFGTSSSVPGGSHGQLFWRRRGPGMDAKETTEESSNSNDGKRSEWADFLSVGDTVQLVPNNAKEVLTNSPFRLLLGVRRIGRPMGADPIVERIWQRLSEFDSGWTLKE